MRADCWDVDTIEGWVDPNLPDSDPPILGTPNPGSGSQVTENFTLTMLAQDASPLLFQVFVDAMQLCQGASIYDSESGGLRLAFPTPFFIDGEEYPIVLAQGTRQVRLVAIDKAGNSAENSVSYTVENTWAAPLLAQATAIRQELQTDPSLTATEKAGYASILNYYSVGYVNPGERTVQDHIDAYLSMKAAYLVAGWEWNLDDDEFLNWWGQYSPTRVLLPFLAARSAPDSRNEPSIVGRIFGWLKDVGKKTKRWLLGDCANRPTAAELSCTSGACDIIPGQSALCEACKDCVWRQETPGFAREGADAAGAFIPTPPSRPDWWDLGGWARDLMKFASRGCAIELLLKACVDCYCWQLGPVVCVKIDGCYK
jgi:hypothetical protein